ncbi:MAG: Ig-like domain-containing protein [Candidatus Symbiothrix sp.]|jgi:hypothetical protein|nr:Ig-like domain-containing protein [Candidatus Symbiothrix sp.]
MKTRILFRELRIKSAMTVALAIACVLVTGNCSPVTAQVAIGGDGSVTTGAVLDLSQQGAATGGLLLPQVTLTAENANPFGEGESLELPDGLMVYNLGGNGNLDAGLYVLQGGLWKPAGSGGGGIPVISVSVIPSDPFSLGVGKTQQMNFTTYPPNATYSSMSWKSDNTDVATVSNVGIITGITLGDANITLQLGSITSDPVTVTVVTCGSVTGASGYTYTAAAYANAGDASGLCWMTENLREGTSTADYTATYWSSYPDRARGYYYSWAQAYTNNICGKLGEGWTIPTLAQSAALVTATATGLVGDAGTIGTSEELESHWRSAPWGRAGRRHGTNWENWDASENSWWVSDANRIFRITGEFGTKTYWAEVYEPERAVVRCVKPL